MKQGISIERAEEIEAQLQAMRNQLSTLFCEVSNAHTQRSQGAKTAQHLQKARQSIDDARWLLQGWPARGTW